MKYWSLTCDGTFIHNLIHSRTSKLTHSRHPSEPAAGVPVPLARMMQHPPRNSCVAGVECSALFGFFMVLVFQGLYKFSSPENHLFRCDAGLPNDDSFLDFPTTSDFPLLALKHTHYHEDAAKTRGVSYQNKFLSIIILSCFSCFFSIKLNSFGKNFFERR
jgi:hypothetical protein